jgi:hypothetical protein
MADPEKESPDSRDDQILDLAIQHAQLMHLGRLRFLARRKSSGLLDQQISTIERELGLTASNDSEDGTDPVGTAPATNPR